MLEKKEKVLIKKAAQEVEKAREFTRAKNKRGMFSDCWSSLDYNAKCCVIILIHPFLLGFGG